MKRSGLENRGGSDGGGDGDKDAAAAAAAAAKADDDGDMSRGCSAFSSMARRLRYAWLVAH